MPNRSRRAGQGRVELAQVARSVVADRRPDAEQDDPGFGRSDVGDRQPARGHGRRRMPPAGPPRGSGSGLRAVPPDGPARSRRGGPRDPGSPARRRSRGRRSRHRRRVTGRFGEFIAAERTSPRRSARLAPIDERVGRAKPPRAGPIICRPRCACAYRSIGRDPGYAGRLARPRPAAYGGIDAIRLDLSHRALPLVGAMLLAVAALGPGATPASAAGPTFYVDGKHGNDANSGTSLGAPFKTVKAGMCALRYGGTLDIVGYDDYVYYETMTSSQWFINGSASAPVVIRAHGYGSGSYVRPIISGAKVVSRPGQGRWTRPNPTSYPEPLADAPGRRRSRATSRRSGAFARSASSPTCRSRSCARRRRPSPSSRRPPAPSTGTARGCTCGSVAGARQPGASLDPNDHTIEVPTYRGLLVASGSAYVQILGLRHPAHDDGRRLHGDVAPQPGPGHRRQLQLHDGVLRPDAPTTRSGASPARATPSSSSSSTTAPITTWSRMPSRPRTWARASS